MFDFNFSEVFEEHEGIVAIIIIILLVLFWGLVAFGWWTLTIYVASCIFNFAFKWIYVLGAWMAYHILQGIFKCKIVKRD